MVKKSSSSLGFFIGEEWGERERKGGRMGERKIENKVKALEKKKM